MESGTESERRVMSEEEQDGDSRDASSLPPTDREGKSSVAESSMMSQESDAEISEKEDVSQEEDAEPLDESTEDPRPFTIKSARLRSLNRSSQEDQEADSVEIPTERSSHKEDDEDDYKKEAHSKHVPHHLNEDTLERLKDYLRSEKMRDTLDEDAIAVRILRTDRAASDRARFHYDLCEDSEEEDDDIEIANRRAYQDAEEYTLALDFYKKTVAEAQSETADVVMDKRTLNWLRKAMGLHRRNDMWETTGNHRGADKSHELSEESEEETGTKGRPRRLTRSIVRSTRIKRREERVSRENRGLDALVSAVTELEGDLGPFPTTPKVSDLSLQLKLLRGINETHIFVPSAFCVTARRNAKGKVVSQTETVTMSQVLQMRTLDRKRAEAVVRRKPQAEKDNVLRKK